MRHSTASFGIPTSCRHWLKLISISTRQCMDLTLCPAPTCLRPPLCLPLKLLIFWVFCFLSFIFFLVYMSLCFFGTFVFGFVLVLFFFSIPASDYDVLSVVVAISKREFIYVCPNMYSFCLCNHLVPPFKMIRSFI
jgi:hypothetical protein